MAGTRGRQRGTGGEHICEIASPQGAWSWRSREVKAVCTFAPPLLSGKSARTTVSVSSVRSRLCHRLRLVNCIRETVHPIRSVSCSLFPPYYARFRLSLHSHQTRPHPHQPVGLLPSSPSLPAHPHSPSSIRSPRLDYCCCHPGSRPRSSDSSHLAASRERCWTGPISVGRSRLSQTQRAS